MAEEVAQHIMEAAVSLSDVLSGGPYKRNPDMPLEINPAGNVEPFDAPEPPMTRPEPGWVNPKAPELLGRAAALMHERGKTYDKPEGERSMGKTVAAFNAVTGHQMRESEGWLFMSLLKLVRSETRSEPHQDSLEDSIAYSALYAEARGEGR